MRGLLADSLGKHESLIIVYCQVNVNLRLPVVLSKFLQGAPLSPADFVNQWRALTGPPLKLVEVVCLWMNAFLLNKHANFDRAF